MQKTILIIDDDAVIIALVNSILKDNGYHVISAGSGMQGVDLARQSLPDLVLLDWNMPGMDGLEVLYALKNDELTMHIPVIMVTGTMTDHDNMLKAFENGVIDFIKKPFDRYELIARTYSILLLSEFYKEKLESKQKELVSTAMRLVEVNEFNMNLLKKIAEIRERSALFSAGIETDLNNLEQMVNSQLKVDQWQQFEDYFKHVNPDFYTNLLSKHTDLSPAELKMCTLLRLNMSSKDIASLLFQTHESVRVSRFRLRKKLKLESEDNLVSYLLSF